MSLSLPALRTFATVARLGSFTLAARELCLTQPAISRHIKLIEAELGEPVFERVPAGARLTAAGRTYLDFVEHALASLADGQQAVRVQGGGEAAQVTLCLAATLCNEVFLRALRRFKSRKPSIDVELDVQGDSQVAEVVLRGDADLGLRYHPTTDPRLRYEVIGHDTVVVICSPKHRLVGKKLVHPQDLGRELWIGWPVSTVDPEGEYRRHIGELGLRASKVTIVHGFTMKNRLVEANLGVSIAVKSAVRKELASGSLHALKVAEFQARVPICMVSRARAHLSPATERLKRLLQREFGAEANG